VEEAVEYGRPVALDALVASERRLVHEYLRDRRDIETYSEGDEPDRRLVVAPVVRA
jgi:spoIIIJ-associated protein